MATIVNNFSHPVILDDQRDPYVSWQHHRERGSDGGVDLAYPYGTPVHANAAGDVLYIPGNGSGGNMGILYVDGGGRLEYLHLSSGGRTGHVSIGDVIGYSGASGFGNDWYYGPHLHVHYYPEAHGWNRRNLWDYFTDSRVSASRITNITDVDGGATLLEPEPEPEVELDMSTIRYVVRKEERYDPEYMIVGIDIPAHRDDDNARGYRVSLDRTSGEAFGAIYGDEDGAPWKELTRKQYIRVQEQARELHDARVTEQKASHDALIAELKASHDALIAELKAIHDA